MAESCRRYVEDVVVPNRLMSGRERIIPYLEDLYKRRLRLPGTEARVDGARQNLENPHAALVEMAHDGQLPHLGIVRLVLKAREVATLAGNGLAMYLVGDHYTAAMRPDNLLLGLPLRGVDADRVKNPLTIPVGRKSRHIPFHRLPPPSNETLDELTRRGEAWLLNNATQADRKRSASELKAHLRMEMERLRESARATKSFGDWIMRVQALWFDELFGGPPSGLAIAPMQAIVDWIPDVLWKLTEADSAMARIKSEVSAAQAARGETPYLPEEGERSVWWIYCRRCWRRFRAVRSGDSFSAECPVCNRTEEVRWPGEGLLTPDIVGFECALFRMGVSGWIVGSRSSYHPVIEAVYAAVFGMPMPPKAFVTSVPRFRGIGEPAEGHGRARLLRVLLEIEPQRLREALETPWEENPEIVSPYVQETFAVRARAQK